jgi:hypothetical protein
MSNPIDAPSHTFQSATLRQANQDRILYAGGARLFRREQAVMLFGDCKQFVHAGARHFIDFAPLCSRCQYSSIIE